MDEVSKLYDEIDEVRELAQSVEGREILTDLIELIGAVELIERQAARG